VERLAESIRAKGDAGLSAWGEPWSNGCAFENPPPLDKEAVLPTWLEGRWRAKAQLDSVSFPMGRRVLSETVPGVRMASILPLPNVGNEPTYELAFYTDAEGAVRADRAANAKTVLEAFWSDAVVTETKASGGGRLALKYEGPTRGGKRVEQSVNLKVCSSEGGLLPQSPQDPQTQRESRLLRRDTTVGEVLAAMKGTRGSRSEWVIREVFQQENLEQGVRNEYLILTTYSRLDPTASVPQAVRCQQRVAAFLLPTDGAYFDALGKPVVLYDYSYVLTRVS